VAAEARETGILQESVSKGVLSLARCRVDPQGGKLLGKTMSAGATAHCVPMIGCVGYV
jgi:hypothetical protein